MSCSRREFIAAAAGAALLPRWLRTEPIHLVIVYSDEFMATARGALVGAGEAHATAGLLRREFRHSLIHINNLNAQSFADATALVTASNRNPALPVHIPVIDAAHAADGPGTVCQPNVWHVPPLVRHARLAREQSDGRAEGWHHTLERFGAGQLNARFVAAGIPTAVGHEWQGWMAVKCLWESALRSQPLGAMMFDGHKGRRLFFGGRSRNLIQPIYIVNDEKVLHEWNPPENAEDPACGSS